MKKVFVVLSLVCFVALNAVNAQNPAALQASKEPVKEVSVTPAATAMDPVDVNCSSSKKKACCKKGGEAKNCSPEERAACSSKAKGEAKAEVEPKTEGK